MTIEIQFIKGLKETTLPIIKLTKSRNGKTGTATFIFIEPKVFDNIIYKDFCLKGMYLLWENKIIETNDLEIFFKNGAPFVIKVVIIFKNSKDWFNFLNFMNYYSKETGLSFSEKNSYS
jgi:photosystem II protein